MAMSGIAVLRTLLALTLCVAMSTAARTQGSPAAEEQVFRAHSDLVVLHVNVYDKRADAVPNLPREAFFVVEDGTPQEISFFENTDVPVAVGLVVDNSGSMITRHGMVAAGGRAFAAASHPDDELFTVIFNEHVRFGLPPTVSFTKNRILLQTALGRFAPGGRTAIYDAVVTALDHLENATHQKRAIVVLSDGDDNASRLTEKDMLDKARRSDAIVYTVSSANAGAAGHSGRPRILRRLADVSGGLAYFPRSDADVVGTFEEIAGNLRRGYSIGYVPTNTSHEGGFRRVQVRVRAPGHESLSVRTRDGYFSSGHAVSR